jgi:tetratricopeptide (TPR) repeat protein
MTSDDLHPDRFDAYLSALRASSDDRLPPAEALRHVGMLIDLSGDVRRVDGARAALGAGNRLLQRQLGPDQRALLHYFLANASEVERTLTRSGWDLESWEQPQLERQIVHLRTALALGEEGALPPERLTQVLTNLGNTMRHCGRYIEAVAYWEQALEIDPDHGMARGNRGYGLERLAMLAHDPGHQRLILRAAHSELCRALDGPLEIGARPTFVAVRRRMEEWAPVSFFEAPPFEYCWPAGMTEEERAYREWGLAERLFLNDLNELGPEPVAAADVLVLPDLVTPLDAGPELLGFFNQMKQEYASARYLLYGGILASEPHYSDRDVKLVNTLDYPAYGLAAEQVKLAFRMGYSLLDKVAYFLNTYLQLGIPSTQVSFKKLWYERKKPYTLRADVQRPGNMPLRGLFWLSKDLFEDDPEFAGAIEPDAQELDAIRQHLEHKYLKLHTSEWSGIRISRDPVDAWRVDTLAHSLYRDDFERRTLRLMRLARAALMYLSAAIYVEECTRRAEKSGAETTLPIELDTYDDEWKS